MGNRNSFKFILALTQVSFFCSSVRAEVHKEDVSGKQYSVSGSKVLDASKSCDVNGIARDYANVPFLRGFFPRNIQSELKNVRWDASRLTMTIEAKDTYNMACEKTQSKGSESLLCSFAPAPAGVSSVWFKITRSKEREPCFESMISEGSFNQLVRAKGYSPAALHEQVAGALLAPYRGSVATRTLAGARGSAPTRQHVERIAEKDPN